MSFLTTALGFATSGGSRKLLMILGVVIVLGLVAAFAAWQGYSAGYDKADALRRAEVAELRGAHTLALATAEHQARAILQEQTQRANDLERQYLAATKTLAAERRTITNERIRNASRDVDISGGTCRLGPEWMRLYNLATGWSDSSDAMPGAASGPDDPTGAGAPTGAGILSGGTTVTPADVLAHMRDYGSRCQGIETQLGTLQEWAADLHQGEETWK